VRTFPASLGADQVTIYAPIVGEFPAAEFRNHFPRGGLYGLDVEGTWMGPRKQFDPAFEVRLIQFATEDDAWVLNLDDPRQHQSAVGLLADPSVQFCSHTNMDVLSVFARLGVDVTGRNVDTRLLAKMVDPDGLDKRDLKTLTSKYLGPQLAALDARLDEEFLRLWLDAGGPRNASKAKGADEDDTADSDVARYGWSAIDADNEVYLTYAGLDAIACRRLVPILAPLTGAPVELLRLETWLAGQANRIQIRGMRIDPDVLDTLQTEAEAAAADVRARLTDLVTSHPPAGCRVWGGWPALKRAAGLSPLSPMLRPHRLNRKGPDGKSIRNRHGKGYLSEPCCDGWLAEHGVDWSTWGERGGAYTNSGAPSLEKNNIDLLDGYPLDAVGRAAVDELKRYRRFHDVLNKTKGIRAGVDPNGRVHPVLHTIGTVTGRMSSVAPNFQNFSKKNPLLRGMFIPEPGHTLITADFDQIELRVVAALAREQKMIDTILAGGDLHQLTADEIGIPRDLASARPPEPCHPPNGTGSSRSPAGSARRRYSPRTAPAAGAWSMSGFGARSVPAPGPNRASRSCSTKSPRQRHDQHPPTPHPSGSPPRPAAQRPDSRSHPGEPLPPDSHPAALRAVRGRPDPGPGRPRQHTRTGRRHPAPRQPPRRRVLRVLRDTENHHGRGVHDADEDPGEPDWRIGEVSPIIGKAPGTLGRCTPQWASRSPCGCS
jgi:hypothetical protein